jgi:hypothetical protein
MAYKDPEKAREKAREYYRSHLEEQKEKRRKCRAINSEASQERSRKWYATYPERARAWQLWKFYRITPEEYATLNEYQSKDPVFQVLLGKGKKRDAVEHRHSDGLIRGLMAPMLNRAYGLIERLYPKNTSTILRALAAFHDSPPATEVLGTPRYGIIGTAKSKKKPMYGSPNGPIKPEKKGKRS